jgi:hypothetical protein
MTLLLKINNLIHKKMRILISILLLAAIACKTNKTTTQTKDNGETTTAPSNPGPPALVYKTKANYNNLVPVVLSDDKKTVTSYPDPTDIKGNYSLPTILNNGYLLDNRGVEKNVAFLKLTYEEYSKLKSAPSPKELYNLIIDKDPLTELCDCGNKNEYTDITKQLNKLIDSNTLKTKCKKIK